MSVPVQAEVIAAGSGPIVLLIHSSVSGARQWRKLTDALKDRYRVLAINLYGYGATPAWDDPAPQTLEDQARLVEAVLPSDADKIHLVGHSFGGSVAMKLAANMPGRIGKLVLLEANPFYLLAQAGQTEAFAEAKALGTMIKDCGGRGDWSVAAETFADYWGGQHTWRDMPPERRTAFAEAIKPNFHEWDAVMNETTPITQWAEQLPRSTLAVCDPATVTPIREIDALLQRACPEWHYQPIAGGGHMAPLTRPDLINPVVAAYLDA